MSKAMRDVFVEALNAHMEKDDRVVVLDADLARAHGTLALRDAFPERALNAGVAEANMVSVAAGLSSYGFIPFCNTFAPFLARRACDQIALSVAYARQNVKLVGSDPGITAELNGGTHFGLEDVAIMRNFVDMVVYEPVDSAQLQQAMPQIIAHQGPVYIRLDRKGNATIFGENYKFDLFKADVLTEGSDVTILALGGAMVTQAQQAVQLLAEKGVSAELISVHTVKPLDAETIVKSVQKTGKVVTVENHSTIGGLYSAVCELLCQAHPAPVTPLGINNQFGRVGKQDYLREFYGLRAEDIAAACL